MSQEQSKCWNCNKKTEPSEAFCHSCKAIQPPSQEDHFSRLSMEKSFEIGMKNLEVAYFAMQRILHPDLFTGKSDTEKSLSVQQSMAVNEAFETLKSPLKRAEYMLYLEDVTVNSDNANTKPLPELLMESMEAREQLAEASSATDIRNMSIKAAEDRLACIDNIKNTLAKNDLDSAAQNTIRLRYLEKLIEEIRLKSAAAN